MEGERWITDALIAALEDAMALLKERHRKDHATAALEVTAVTRKGEAAILRAGQADPRTL